MYLLVLQRLTTMTILAIMGFLFAKAVKVDEGQQKFLSKLLLYFINTSMIINSFNIDFSLQKLKEFGLVVAISIAVHVVMILVLLPFTQSKDEKAAGLNAVERLAGVFTNCGFIGIPLIRGVFGDEGIFYLMGYVVVFNVLVWTYGMKQMSGSISIKKIVTNPVIIACAIGLVIFILPFKLPKFISEPLSMVADMNTAMAMVLIGVLFANFHYDRRFTFRLIKLSLLRLVICPLASVLVLFVIYKLFNLAGLQSQNLRLVLFVTLIGASCPSATSVPSMACLFDKDTSYASLCISITSLLCIMTIPSVVALGELLIK